MSASKREQELIALVEPLVVSHGFDLVDLEVVGGSKSPTIRVYLDRPDEAGVLFDDLADANRWLGDAIEERDPFPGAYVLEVSSPGIDRPLRRPADYARHVGDEVSVRLERAAVTAHGGRGTIAGTIAAADETSVTVDTGVAAEAIPFDDIRKAHIKGHIDFTRKD